jgi:diguanylate cyclase (GGDEF)-like protein
MDLDRFKTINDTMGHPIGDSILYQLSAVLQEHIRAIDAAGRCGGDEFAIMLPETDLETGQAVAERIRREVESHCFYAISLEQLKSPDFVPDERKIIHPTVTIGVASYPQDDQSASGLVMAADVALFRAKRLSRNRVCTYSAEPGENDSSDSNKLYKMLQQRNIGPSQIQSVLADAKSKYTRSHAESVTAYAMAIGKALGVDRDTLDGLKVAGLLHDLGKIGMPESILNKPGSLTREEQETVKLHPVIGGRILAGLLQNESVVPAIIGHHERWDGAGYPNGLAGENIPLMARILAVADAFDAMTSDRPYRKAMSTQDALIELSANAGKQFDPQIVDACINKSSVDASNAIIVEDNMGEITQSTSAEPVAIIDIVKLSGDNQRK